MDGINNCSHQFPSSSNVQISASCKLPFPSVVIERKRRFFHRFFIASSTDEKGAAAEKRGVNQIRNILEKEREKDRAPGINI